MYKTFVLICLLCFYFTTFAQQTNFKITLPTEKNWNISSEGTAFKFKITCTLDTVANSVKYAIQQGKQSGMNLDSTGRFSWTPGYHLVDRIEQEKIFQLIIEANTSEGHKATTIVDITVKNINRTPIIADLRPFYIKYNTPNIYIIREEEAYDEDKDPIVFVPTLDSFPEGMTMNAKGEISWMPSLNQFKNIKEKPIFIDFYLQEQPTKTQIKGKIKIEVTQQDLPPQITAIPKNDHIIIKETENVNIRFYLSDPNGDDDLSIFDYLTNQQGLSKAILTKKTLNQYEFSWLPGYDFVQDPTDSLTFSIDFFSIDKTQKRDVKQLKFTVINTVNELETDTKLYAHYYGTLTRAWEILEQLKEKEEELKKAYNRARKGKKNRSVINASLGATTGLSSILSKKSDTQRTISTIGGTTVLTIGTLEATEVIGKSMKDLIDRLNYVIEKKNELQTKGDIFSRDFSLKSTRRNQDFIKKVDDFMATMNLKGLVALELNAVWESKHNPTETSIKKTFKDFNAW
jgi:hypothetical protein